MNEMNSGVLVVDDEPLVRSLLKRSLVPHGFVVWTAANGWEAIELYCRYQTQLALSSSMCACRGSTVPRPLGYCRTSIRRFGSVF